jgi:hypothetical protein
MEPYRLENKFQIPTRNIVFKEISLDLYKGRNKTKLSLRKLKFTARNDGLTHAYC